MSTPRQMSRLFVKRLRIAWRFRVWPWAIQSAAVLFLSLDDNTPEDIEATRRCVRLLTKGY